jgi:hypothetical protein
MRVTMRRLSGGVVVLVAVIVAPGVAPGQSYVYPTRGQSPQQQQKDQGECHVWATQQSGVNPAAMAPPPSGPTGQVVGTAARGAAIGAVGGAIGGNAGKGAAIGATTGALVGGFKRADQRRGAEQAQAQASAAYSRANTACLEGRGYTVK